MQPNPATAFAVATDPGLAVVWRRIFGEPAAPCYPVPVTIVGNESTVIDAIYLDLERLDAGQLDRLIRSTAAASRLPVEKAATLVRRNGLAIPIDMVRIEYRPAAEARPAFTLADRAAVLARLARRHPQA